MRSVKKLFGFILVAVIFAGCGAGSGGSPAPMPQAGLGGPIIMTSHKFTPPGYPYTIVYFVPQVVSEAPSQDSGAGEVTLGETTPPAPAPSPHTLVTGSLVHSGYAEGSFLVEARPSTPCGDEVCADLSAKPFASVKVVKPGYFALVTPRVEGDAFLVATYSHPTDGTSTREHHLGAVGDRVNGIVLDFSPEAPPPPEGDPIPPGALDGIGDLFERAQEAMDSLDNLFPDNLRDIL